MTKGNDAPQRPITDLPNELLKSIFMYLDPVSIGRMAQVNRQMNVVSSDPFVWKDNILSNLAKNKVSPLTHSWIAKLLMSGLITPQLFVEPTIYVQINDEVLKKILSPIYQQLYSNGFTVKLLAGFDHDKISAQVKYSVKLIEFKCTIQQISKLQTAEINFLGVYIDKLSTYYTPTELVRFDFKKINSLGRKIDILIKHFTSAELAGFDSEIIEALSKYLDILIKHFPTAKLAEYDSKLIEALGKHIVVLIKHRPAAELAEFDPCLIETLGKYIDKLIQYFSLEQILKLEEDD